MIFEVASIKHSAPEAPGLFIQPQPGGGLRIAAATLKHLIAFAYNVREFEISGAPTWAGSDRFDIDARPERSAQASAGPAQPADQRRTVTETRERLKSLLADRFQLAIHREDKEQNVYVLLAAKNGSKLREADPEWRSMVRGRNGTITGQAVAIDMLVINLANQLGRPVLDRTGLKGKYDFNLEWTPGANAGPAPTGTPLSENPSPGDPGLSLFTALQEQLGLRLESQKGKVEVLVIDRAERPSEN